MFCERYSPEEQTEILMSQYEHEAYELMAKHVSKKILLSFAKFLCEFCLEDEALKLMDMMNIRRIHIAAIEQDALMFNKLIDKEFEE